MNSFKNLPVSGKVKIILSTFFFVGYVPIAPGTAGTAAAILLYCMVAAFKSVLVYVTVMTIISAVAVWASEYAERFYGIDDPPEIVIDEVAGFMIAMLFIEPSLLHIILGFFLFRILDIMKVFPARAAERLKGGLGVVADDLVSGVYTNILLHLLLPIIHLF